MNLSFAWTADAYRRGDKTATRRFWTERTFKAWCNAWDQGRRQHLALDGASFRGGKGSGYFELTKRPYKQRLADMTADDLRREATPATTPKEFAKFVGKSVRAIAVVIEFRAMPQIPTDQFPGLKLKIKSTPHPKEVTFTPEKIGSIKVTELIRECKKRGVSIRLDFGPMMKKALAALREEEGSAGK